MSERQWGTNVLTATVRAFQGLSEGLSDLQGLLGLFRAFCHFDIVNDQKREKVTMSPNKLPKQI